MQFQYWLRQFMQTLEVIRDLLHPRAAIAASAHLAKCELEPRRGLASVAH